MTDASSESDRTKRIERALEGALERLEIRGHVSEAWLKENYPGCSVDVRALLEVDALAAGGRSVMSRLGPWRLRRMLGRGGMGAAFLAEATAPVLGRLSGERLVVKVIHPHLLEGPEAAARLQREAAIGSRVRHPSIAAAYGIDRVRVNGETLHLVVMEYVDGVSLRDRLDKEGPLSEAALRAVALHALAGLDAMHLHGIVHRDVKPDNLVQRADGTVCLVDFGLAWLEEGLSRLTDTGRFLGTRAYAAPEQIVPRRGVPDARSDLFALGATLYELATGRTPWPDRASNSPGVVAGVGTCPCAGEATQLHPRFAQWIDDLLELHAERRPASASLAAARLEAIPTGAGVGAVATPPAGGEIGVAWALGRALSGEGAALVCLTHDEEVGTQLLARLVGRARRSDFEVLELDGSDGPSGFAGVCAPTLRVARMTGDLDRLRISLISAIRGRGEDRPLLLVVRGLGCLDPDSLSLWWTCVDAVAGGRSVVAGVADLRHRESWIQSLRRRPHAFAVEVPMGSIARRTIATTHREDAVLREAARSADPTDLAAQANRLGISRWALEMALLRVRGEDPIVGRRALQAPPDRPGGGGGD